MAASLAATNLNLLVALEALLSECSVTRAAQRCGVTQGAMSQSLGQLRRLLDDPLLVRGKAGMVATPRAQRLRGDVTRALAEVRNVFEERPAFDPKSSRQRVRIASEDAVAVLLLTQLVPLLEREAPGIDIDFVPFHGAADMVRLETGEVDFACDVGLVAHSGIRSAAAFPDDLVAIARRGHPEIGRQGLDLDTYCRLAHLSIGTVAPHVVSVVDRGLAALGRERRVALRLKSFNAAPPIVASSSLVWNGPRRLAEYYAGFLPLQIHEIPLDIPSYTVDLYWHARFEKEAAHQWMRERVLGFLRAT